MANPLIIQVKESVEDIKKYIKEADTQSKKNRIRILLEIKKAGEKGISKRDLAKRLKICHNTVQEWRIVYKNEGMAPFLEDDRTGFKPSVVTIEEHDALKVKLNDPKNGLKGYVELTAWYMDTFGKNIKYNTLLKYCVRKFKSSCKVARKSHLKKNEDAVIVFKKTSIQSVMTPLNTRKTGSKK